MSTGKAFPALHHNIRVTTAAKLQVHVAIWETAVEEVWSRPEVRDRGTTEMSFSSTVTLRTVEPACAVYSLYLPTTSLMMLVKTPFKTRVRLTAG